MVFNSDVFLLGFLPVVYVLFWSWHSKQFRYTLLALAGYVFYGWWNWRFCGLLLFSSLVSYLVGIAIDSSASRSRARNWMLFAVSIDLTLLGFFKYYNFFTSNLLFLWPQAPFPLLNVVLPVGISFYTFHTISYIIDVYDGRVKATRNLWEYFTYVNLFSQLVAGPIVRFRQIEQDLEHIDGPPRDDWTARGIAFFLVGLIKKVMIADHIAAIIDPMLKNYSSMTFADSWTAALGYSFQLYFDFSGYSDMAIGLGYLFGLRIPQNFDMPYRAADITEFWRKWHISLSSWLRDYLYIRLGGNRKGAFRTYVNLLITMLLGGLWHGANWTFVFWGGYHGLLLALDRLDAGILGRLPRPLRQLHTFILVLIGWVFFRSDNFPMALAWLRAMFWPQAVVFNFDPRAAGWIALAILWVGFLPETWNMRFGHTLRWAPIYAAGLLFCYLFMNGTESVFLYFQF